MNDPYLISLLPDVIEKHRPYRFDDDGVLLEKIPYKDEWVYNPTMIACHVIRYRDDANTGWLLDHQLSDGSIPHLYQSAFSPPSGWIGGLSQSFIASALFQMGYVKNAQLAIDALFEYCYQDGIIYERPDQLILNGWIYGIFSLMQLGRERINETLTCLVEKLPCFDAGRWSRYDNTGILATPFYHQIHMLQLRELFLITGNQVFLTYTSRWDEQCSFPVRSQRVLQLMKRHKLGIVYQWRKRQLWLAE